MMRCDVISSLVRFSEYKAKTIRASNFTVNGEGTALVNTPLLQTKAFWEFKISELASNGSTGFVFGVAARDGASDLDKPISERKNSWGWHSAKSQQKLKKGDIVCCVVARNVTSRTDRSIALFGLMLQIGVSYDLSDVRPVLSFTLNGVEIPDSTIRDVRSVSDLYPAVSIVGPDGMVEANFGQSTNFTHPQSGFQALMMARDTI